MHELIDSAEWIQWVSVCSLQANLIHKEATDIGRSTLEQAEAQLGWWSSLWQADLPFSDYAASSLNSSSSSSPDSWSPGCLLAATANKLADLATASPATGSWLCVKVLFWKGQASFCNLRHDSQKFFQGAYCWGFWGLHQDFQRADAFRTRAAETIWESTHISQNFSTQLSQELSVLFQKVAGE